jgi:hypothetical protein
MWVRGHAWGAGWDSSYPDPFFVSRDRALNITSIALKSVAFLGVKQDEKFLPRATCFFAQITDGQHRFDHLVTAKHVISGLLSRGHDIWLRVNLTNGKGGALKLDGREFRFHPNAEQDPTDVAVCPISHLLKDDETGATAEIDYAPLALNGEGSFVPDALFCERYIGPGGEIAIIGLFSSHHGEERNIPIVRVGNISMIPEVPVKTKLGFLKAYLVEARSIAGLSGSPVFCVPNLGLELAHGMVRKPNVKGLALLGLMHGHFDVPNLNEDVVADDDTPERSVHTGIGVVIPLEKIIETINHPELSATRRKIVSEGRAA